MFSSERRFRLWDYKVSHKQLLIRSPRGADVETNVDLVFWGVERMDLATSFDGLVLSTTDEGHFQIQTDGKFFQVVASGFKVLENSLDIFDSSLEGFAATSENRDLGTLLAHS